MQCSPCKETLLVSPELTWLNSGKSHGGGLGHVGLLTQPSPSSGPAVSSSWCGVERLQVRRVSHMPLTASYELFSDHIFGSASSVLCQGEAEYGLVSGLLFAVCRSLQS